MSDRHESYLRWGIGIAMTVIIFLLGSHQGVSGVRAELNAHEKLEGHPVELEILKRIERKIDKESVKMESIQDDINDLKMELEKIKRNIEQ